MSRGGATRKKRREPDILDERRDVIVKVPPIIINTGGKKLTPDGPDLPVSDKEVIKMQQAMITELERECERQRLSATTIAVTTCALIKAICDGTGIGVSPDEAHAVQIPRELFERLRGSELEIANWQNGRPGDVYARIVPKSSAPQIGGS